MKATTARRLRQIHRQIGLFFAPAILFFSLSGALQTLGWHEARGGSGPPAAWIAWMASIHKDQRVPSKPREAPHAQSGPADGDHHDDHDGHGKGAEGPSPVPMKVFVICLAVALIASSLSGAAIAVSASATRQSALVSLALGVLVPAVLLIL
jgi:hypothetical protein